MGLMASLLPAIGAAAALIRPDAADIKAASTIDAAQLRAHVRFLADDALEGRLPGSRGDQLAQRYIVAQFEALGLKPGAPGGGWLQIVPLVGVRTQAPAALGFTGSGKTEAAERSKDFMLVSGLQESEAGFKDAELVFVGYGIRAPEFGWDDFKGADLRGKVLLVMNNDPEEDPALFAGKTRLYYGRWTYKYEEAARRGAAAALIIHTTPSAGYPWQVVQTSWAGEQFELESAGEPRLPAKGWLTEEASRRVAALGGRDLDVLRRKALSPDFQPVALGVRVSASLKNQVRRQESANVLALLEGSHPELKSQSVIYSAHHDHLGVSEDASKPDRIYNGALDNASGTAALLALAGAFKGLPKVPPRSILFAALAAEEQGLLGSAYLAAHPPVPPGRLAAAINIDGINILGRTRDVVVVGYGKSSLDRLLEGFAAWQGRVVKPDSFPDRGFYYRSDQFNFAKIGIPSVFLGRSVDFIGRPEGWGREMTERWEATHYHQPSDEYRDDWDLSGAVENLRLLFHVGARAARDSKLPAWTAGDEFEAARKAALAAP